MQPSSLIQSAQDQAEQSMQNQSPLGITPSSGSTANAESALQQSNQLNQPQVNTPQQGNSPSLLERLLPTIGSVGGGILGDIGLPVVGGVAGSAAGGALGKFLEDKLTGQAGGNGVLGAAGEGAIGQGLGEGIGALLGAGGKGLEGLAGKMADSQATKAAADAQTASDQADLDAANATKNNFGKVKDTVQGQNNLGPNQDLLKSWDVDETDPQQMKNASQGGLFINKLDNESLALGSPIKTTDLVSGGDVFKATPEEQQAMAESGIIGDDGKIPQTVTPVQANQFAQSLNNQMRDIQQFAANAKAAGRGEDYSAATAQYNNLNKLYKNVQNVASTPEVNEAIASRVVTPAEKASLVTQYGQKEADYIEQAVNTAQTHADLVKAKLPFAQMNDLSSQALQDLKATGTARAVARAKGSAVGNKGNMLTPDSVVNAGSLFEGTLGHHPLALAAPLVMKAAESPAVVGGAGSILSKVGASALPGAVGTAAASLPNTVAPAAGNGEGGVTMDPNQSSLAQMLVNADMDNVLSGGLTQLPGAVSMLQKTNEAQAAEQNLAQNFNLAGGAQGPIGGILSRLGAGLTGGEAAQYPAQAQADQQAIAQALGIPAQEISTPSINEDQSAAQASLGNIQSLIQALMTGQQVTQ